MNKNTAPIAAYLSREYSFSSVDDEREAMTMGAEIAQGVRDEICRLATEVASEVGGKWADTHRLNTGLNALIKRLNQSR
jgi:hypothetical protein